MAKRFPDFLLIGAMRSGTSSLYRYLGGHPEVFMASPKEIHYFNGRSPQDEEWYAALFADALPEQLCGEATPTYLAEPDARRGMKQLVPNARLIAVLREPVQRAWSQYWMMKERGLESREFEAIVSLERQTISHNGPNDGSLIYLGHGMYAHHLTQLLELFPRSALHLLLFERLRDNPMLEYQGLCRFLGIDDGVQPDILGRQVNPYVQFRSLGLRNLAKKMPGSVERLIGKLNTRTKADYPDMPDGLRADLIEFFAPMNVELAERFELNLESWPK